MISVQLFHGKKEIKYYLENGIKTLLILSNFSLSLLYDFEKDETLN